MKNPNCLQVAAILSVVMVVILFVILWSVL